MKVPFGLQAGLAVVEARMLPGVAEGKLDLEAEDAFRRQVRVGAAWQDMHHLQPAPLGLGTGREATLAG